MSETDDQYILIGYTQKPYGLLGEMKVSPTTFDLERHKSLSKIFFRKKLGDEIIPLEIRGTRADQDSWYFKFKDYKTPESIAEFSGGQLLIPIEERLLLPDDMVYVSELPGMKVVDEAGAEVGEVVEVLDQGASELLVIATGSKDIHIPWNDHFVKKIDKLKRIVDVDLTILRDVL